MPNSKSTYLRTAIYKAIFRNISFQGVAQLYMALHDGDPGLVGDNEIVGNDYARTAISMADDGGDGVGASSATVTFPTPDPAGWGTVTHFSIWDAAVGGNMYVGDALAFPIVTSPGVPISFPIGNVTHTET